MTIVQRGIYRELIDEYMLTREPLPNDDAALADIARVTDEVWEENKAVILAKFYDADGFLSHEFCDENLEKQDKISKKRSKASKKAALTRWEKKKKPIMRDACETDANAMRKNAKGKERKGKDIDTNVSIPPTPQRGAGLPDWIDPQDWDDFKKMRVKIKKPMTDRAAKGIIKKLTEFMAKGHDPKIVLEQSIINSWQDVYEPKPAKGEKHETSKHIDKKASYLDKVQAAGGKALRALEQQEREERDFMDAVNNRQLIGEHTRAEPKGQGSLPYGCLEEVQGSKRENFLEQRNDLDPADI